MADTTFYVLVESSTVGWQLYNKLRSAGASLRISPVPRGLQACCGMSLLVEPKDIDKVKSLLEQPGMPPYEDIVEIQNQRDPTRDVYC